MDPMIALPVMRTSQAAYAAIADALFQNRLEASAVLSR